jgi:type II secretory pathway pseudopilin PulG
MVVVVVIAIMSTIAFASYQGTQRQANVDDLASRTYAALEIAKAESALRSEPVGCNLFNNGIACFTLVPGADRVNPNLQFAGGMLDETGDVTVIVTQERYLSANPINTLPAQGVYSPTVGLFYFQSDGTVVGGDMQPTDFQFRLLSHETAGAQAAFRIRSTGSIVKEL